MAVNPKTIFSAVAAVCLMMILVLPRLAVSSDSSGAALSTPAAAGQVLAEAVAPVEASAAGASLAGAADLALNALAAPVSETPAPEIIAEAPAAPLPDATLPPFDIPFAEPPPNPQPEAPAVAPDLQSFAASVTNGDPGTVTGVYAEGAFALPVLQQPSNDHNFISDEDGTVTQFSRPLQFGVTGLLAHNTLSGRLFFKLRKADEITLVFGDGRLARYRIRDLQNYQALSPYDTRSDFVDLNNPGAQLLSHTDLYQRVYTTASTLVLQTCIEANGEPTWGRLFIIADPL